MCYFQSEGKILRKIIARIISDILYESKGSSAGLHFIWVNIIITLYTPIRNAKRTGMLSAHMYQGVSSLSLCSFVHVKSNLCTYKPYPLFICLFIYVLFIYLSISVTNTAYIRKNTVLISWPTEFNNIYYPQ